MIYPLLLLCAIVLASVETYKVALGHYANISMIHLGFPCDSRNVSVLYCLLSPNVVVVLVVVASQGISPKAVFHVVHLIGCEAFHQQMETSAAL